MEKPSNARLTLLMGQPPSGSNVAVIEHQMISAQMSVACGPSGQFTESQRFGSTTSGESISRSKRPSSLWSSAAATRAAMLPHGSNAGNRSGHVSLNSLTDAASATAASHSALRTHEGRRGRLSRGRYSRLGCYLYLFAWVQLDEGHHSVIAFALASEELVRREPGLDHAIGHDVATAELVELGHDGVTNSA